MIKDYLISISEELFEKLPDYVKHSLYWFYKYTPELKSVSYTTICSEGTYKILLGLLEYIEKEELNERKKEKR